MRMNTRGRYGIQLLTQLACHVTDNRPLGLRQVAERTGLPWRYLEQIARPLRRAALIKGRIGRVGGYSLARLPETITLREVIEATDGPLCLMNCVDLPSVCEHSPTCPSRAVWVSLTNDLRDVLSRYSLADLATRPCAECQELAERAHHARERRKAAPVRSKRPGKKWRFMRTLE
ncbi:MAG: Rrf2 family transcriptional regulator [Acidobacteriota bacterium]